MFSVFACLFRLLQTGWSPWKCAQWATLLSILSFFSFPAAAQSSSITGTVKDASQGVVADASVHLRRLSTGYVVQTNADAQGLFVFNGIAPGTYEIEVLAHGFDRFLQSGIVVNAGKSTALEINLSLPSSSETVNVSASQLTEPNVSQVGPFTNLPLQDTPYSINIMTSDLIESVQASTVDQLWRLNPFVENPVPQTRTGSGVGYIRGFYTNNQREDGLYSAFPLVDIEDKESVQVLSGESGFLYGVNPPGGLVNYALKRPTLTRYNSVTFGTYGNGSVFAHGDFSGPIDQAGQFGYRLNLLGQDGSTAINYQNISRYLLSGALDWHVASNALLRFDTSYSHYRVDGSPAVWQLGYDGPVPAAPDASTLYGQKYDFDSYRTNKSGLLGTWDLNNYFTLRGGADHMSYERQDFYTNNAITTATTYNSIVLPFAPRNITTYSGQAFLDAKWSSGPIKNLFTFGYDGDIYRERRHEDQSAVITLAKGLPYPEETYLGQPAYNVGLKVSNTISRMINRNLILADTVNLGQHWTVMAGAAYAGLIQNNFAVATGAQTARYNKSEWTPSASIVFKPIAKVSTYFTYIQGLRQGGTAPDTSANPGVVLPPIETSQYELGAKAALGKAQLTFALFNISEGFEYIDPADNLYKQAGRENHKGLELGLTGPVYRGLRIYGGITLLDPRVKSNASNPQLNDSRPPSVAKQLYKLYSEYDIPQLRGLGVTGGVFYTGRSPADQPNRYYVPAFTTGDVGLRYRWSIKERPLTLRANVTNVTNKSYWMASVFGSNLYTGDPRSVAVSLQTRF